MNTPEHNNFTALRLILALLVVLGHFVTLPGNEPAEGLFGYATFAVDIFFVVSGYLIFSSFDNRPAMGGFYIRRLFRIYPLYATVIVAQAIVMAAMIGNIFEHCGELLHYIALNLIMANFMAHDMGGLLSGLHNNGINPSLWTLKIEFAFYIILPMLLYLTERFGGWFLLLIYVASTSYAIITTHYGMDTLAKQLPGQMRFFITGIALYRYHRLLTFPTVPGIMAACLLFVLCKYYPGAPAVMAVYPLCAGLFMFISVFRLPVIALPFDISYGVYLIHGPLIQFSLLLGIFSNTSQFLALLLSGVLLLALLAERFVEQPGIEFGKRLARTWVARFTSASI